MSPQKWWIAPVAILALGVVGGAAHAATDIVSGSSGTIDFGTTNPDTFTVQSFNENLGTLDSIAIDLSLESTPTFEVFNFNGGAGTFDDGSVSYTATVTGPGTITLASVPISDTGVSGSINPAQYSITDFTGTTTSSASNMTDPTDLADYETNGAGTVTLSLGSGLLAVSGTQTSGSSGQQAFGGDATASADASVTYTYTPNANPAPEPAQMAVFAFLALGLGGLMWRARRRATA